MGSGSLRVFRVAIGNAMSAVNWTSIKNGLHAWLLGSSGLTPERIIFGGQNAVRPKGQDQAWISIWIMGDDWVGHGVGLYKDNPTPTPGAEVIKEIHNQRMVTITVTCFGPKDATDATEAHAIMSDALCDLDLDEVTDPLDVAGVGFFDFSAVTTIGGTIGTTRIEPRSVCTLRFLTPSLVSRTMTFIETVNTELHVSPSHTPVDGESGTDVKVFDFEF